MADNRSKTLKKTSKAVSSSSAQQLTITLLGDSTIDNKIWVFPGLYGNALMNKLGMQGSSPRTRVRRSHSFFSLGTELSVVENLMDMLPNCRISDYTNDGFTTTDCLRGNYKDKVFPRDTFREFPHERFKPLEAAKSAIEESNYIVISVGGNNFREFLQGSFSIADKEERIRYIRQSFPALVERTKKEYVELLQHVFEMNRNATLVLMTQYYPSFTQNDYKIYDFMTEVGAALYEGNREVTTPQDVIHHLVKQLYSGVLDAIRPYADRLVIADLTSSLNPHDPANHVKQIEPSGIGGRRIASMLTYLMTENVTHGHVYQFSGQANQHVHHVSLDAWTPKHPDDFKGEQALQQVSKMKM